MKKILSILVLAFISLASSNVYANKAYYYYYYYYDDYKRFDKVIRVNTFANKLSYYEKGIKIGEMDISAGNFESYTPRGRFRITNKHPLMYSTSAGKFMPYWMEFYNGIYGIHSLPQDSAGNIDTTSIIGQPANGGCVRLYEENAKKLYDWADYGTYVLVDYNKNQYASKAEDISIIHKYFNNISNGKYEDAYNLRLVQTYNFKTFLNIYNGIKVDVTSITQRKNGDYLVEAKLYKGDKFLFSSKSVFQISNGKIVRSFVVR